jgi:glucosamine-6-phosphate deaminase
MMCAINETIFKSEIWHAGRHNNPFSHRLTTFIIAEHIVDTSVPISLLADHPNVQFNFYICGLVTCEVVMH